jgi:uncharacterized lipoprotein YbaY
VITVSGAAVVPAGIEGFPAASVHVEVRDATLADAPSVLLASRTYDGVAVRPGARLPFALTVADAPEHALLSLRVHVDVAGDGAVASGDLLSTRFHPLPTSGPVDLDVPLTAIP